MPGAAGAAWRLLLGDGTGAELESPGARNMAVDDALLASAAGHGPPTLRFYRWRPACLSVGRNQPVTDALSPEDLRGRGWDLVRRPTGGLAVLHADEITYAVAAPVAVLGRPRAAYAAVSAALAEGLRDLGIVARVHTAGGGAPAPGPPGGAEARSRGRLADAGSGAAGYLGGAEARCFAAPAPGEVTARGRKILGSAQRRSGGALLQHGSLLLSGTQDEVSALFARTGPGPALVGPTAGHRGTRGDIPAVVTRARAGETTVAEELGCVPPDARIVAALAGAFARNLASDLERGGLEPAERALAERRATAYSSQAWTWRR